MHRDNIMKYLKYFESHEDYFTEVDEISPAAVFRRNQRFSEEEIDTIRKVVDSKSGTLHLYKNPKGNDLRILEMDKNRCWIYKVSDEWYYLFRRSREYSHQEEVESVYKCDQIEGLLKCIEIKIL